MPAETGSLVTPKDAPEKGGVPPGQLSQATQLSQLTQLWMGQRS